MLTLAGPVSASTDRRRRPLRRGFERRSRRAKPAAHIVRRGPLRRGLAAVGRAWRRGGPELRNWKGQAHLFALAVISALIMRLAYPRWNVAVVAAFGLAPFLWAVGRAAGGKQAFYIGWVFGGVFYYGLCIWLNVLIQYHPIIPAAIVLMGLYLGLFKGLFAWIAWKLHRRGPLPFLGIPAAWVATEYLQSLGDLGFPWGYLGHSLWRHPPLIQLAAWTGVYGLSLVLFWINHLVCDGVRLARREAGAPRLRALAIRLAILAAMGGAGLLAYRGAWRAAAQADDRYSTPPITIGIVQPNIAQPIKLRSYSWDTPEEERERLQNEILNKTLHISDRLQTGLDTRPCDLIIWPETAVTDDFFVFRLDAYRTLFEDLATTRFHTSLLFGMSELRFYREGRFVEPRAFDPDDYNRHFDQYTLEIYNNASLADPERGLVPNVYRKTRLVPFGEGLPYVRRIKPLADLISAICQMVPLVPSKEHRVCAFQPRDPAASPVTLGPLICYESCYPDLSRKRVRLGAEVLVVITNDAWYDLTAGAAQHQLQSVFRAVETRRWVARSANHGISCFVSPVGEIVVESELARDAALKHAVRGAKTLTFYCRWGELFSWLMLIAAVGFLVAGKRKP